MSLRCSVCICTHNPRPDYLQRTLDALRGQSLPLTQWELIVVDNASSPQLAGNLDVLWHPNGRVVAEDELGLTPARLKGISEAVSPVLAFVDDDNVLDPEYLATSLRILDQMTWLGAIGGQISPDYEVPPPPWLKPYEYLHAIRKTDQPRWSNSAEDWRAQPWGAGMVVRRSVCERYSELLSKDRRRRGLDRKGNSLVGGGDQDLVYTSSELGLGFGVFPELKVIHLIAQQRMTEHHILSIVRGVSASRLLLAHLRGDALQFTARPTFYTELRKLYHFITRPRMRRRIEAAEAAGEDDFRRMLHHSDSSA